MLFTSDNWAGMHPRILDAIVEANGPPAPAYGADDLTATVYAQFSDVFGTRVTPAFVATGSAANALALACLTPPWGAILTQNHAHIHLDEAGAPEFFTGGAKIVPLPSPQGKLTPGAIDEAMRFFLPAQNHHVVPTVVSITQGTEAGTVYTVEEVCALSETAKRYGLSLHMDGARFANAVASLGVSAKALTVDAGVDVLTLGGTKNGCMVAEAILFFDERLSKDLIHRQKRAGQGFSKNRFLAAQWAAYLTDDLWLDLAAHANGQARRLAKALSGFRACEVVNPTEINEVFVRMPDRLAEDLRAAGAAFYDWMQPGDIYSGELRRLVTSFATEPDSVDAFIATLKRVHP